MTRIIGRSRQLASGIQWASEDVASGDSSSVDHIHQFASEPVELDLIGNWQNYGGGYPPARYWKIANFIQLEGVIKNAAYTEPPDENIWEVPEDIRPGYLIGASFTYRWDCPASEGGNRDMSVVLRPSNFKIGPNVAPPPVSVTYMSLNPIRWVIKSRE